MSGTGTTSIRSYNFWLDTTIAGAGTYVDNSHPFLNMPGNAPFQSNSIHLKNDGAAAIFFSFDGVTDHGRVAAGQELLQNFRRATAIWFRGTAGGAYRFWAW